MTPTQMLELVQMNVRVPATIALAAKRMAAHRGITMNALVELAIKQLMVEDAAALREQMKAEKDQVAREQNAMESVLADLELANS